MEIKCLIGEIKNLTGELEDEVEEIFPTAEKKTKRWGNGGGQYL